MPESSRTRLRHISSAQNSLVKGLRRAFSRGELTEDGHCAIEGLRIAEEAIRSGLRFRAVFFRESATSAIEHLLPQIGAHVEAIELPDSVFDSAVDTETPQGIAALVKLKSFDLDDILRVAEPLVLVAAGVQDPGNLGTMLRSAEAFRATGVLVAEKTVSHTSPKTVRASAGSVFRLPIVAAPLDDAITKLRQAGVKLIATSSHKGTAADEADLSGSLALFIGNEGAGLPRGAMKEMDLTVAVPHSPKVESLNAGIAASILLYEAARQRKTWIHHGDTESRRTRD